MLTNEAAMYSYSALREGELPLYRGSGYGLAPILSVAPVGGRALHQHLQQLEHEYGLKALLHPDWAARPLELAPRDGRMSLVLEDPGGELLHRLVGRPMHVQDVLRIGVALSVAVRRMHEQDLIHKDIKPENILVDLQGGSAWLTGFGIATRLPRERQNPELPEVIAGTLAYMAPEQTGRMNRSIDSRTDLYSLGVTFYEMLTGALPFKAIEPMEWVHCHVARQPVAPSDRTSSAPLQLSAIVMKLLAKTAEERYQTAAGVEADLRRCLAAWQSAGRIDPFPLGAEDTSDRLMIRERLYGREREIETLLAAFDRVVSGGATELVLVSGYSGIGKSSVVNELHKVLVPPRGLFASGKFDQFKRDIPYATLAQAFQNLVRPLLGQSEVEVGRWRDSLREALGRNGQLITTLIPELELIIGKQPPVADLTPEETRTRFQSVFRRFLGVFARPEHPLALFLDDLQWLDAATLDLLEHLVTDSGMRHLLLVGAYRDNEVGPLHPLSRILESIHKTEARVREIVLPPLSLGDICRFVADSLHCERGDAQLLAELIHEKTGGNPFFAIQFFAALNEEKLLTFDRGGKAWTWDLAHIRSKGFTDNIVDLMVAKLSRLPTATQDALKMLACLGTTADTAVLSTIRGEPVDFIHESLWEAVRAGLVFLIDGKCAFLHDRVREAAYSLIPPDQRSSARLGIGRRLVSAMSDELLDEMVFDVVIQFNVAAGLISNSDEIELAADLNLRAGRKAKASTAYASACHYFSSGMALLNESYWSARYELMFSLWLERAECEFLATNFDTAEQLIGKLLLHAVSKIDRAAVYNLKLLLHGRKSEYTQALESGLACLTLFGIDISANPTWEEVEAEYQLVWRNLDGRSIESLIDLPLMIDPELHAAMRLLSVLVDAAFFTDLNFFCLHLCRMVNISLQHGISPACSQTYGWVGFMLGPVFHRYTDGFRFSKLACDLLEKYGFLLNQTTVYHAIALVAVWTQPIETALEYGRKAVRSGVETGELTMACYALTQPVPYLLVRGDPLDAVWRESERCLDFVQRVRFPDVEDILISEQRFIATMQGRTTTFSTFSDGHFDEADFEAQLTPNRASILIVYYWMIKLKARFLSGDCADALAAASKVRSMLAAGLGVIKTLDYFFYTALAVAVRFEHGSADEQSEWRTLLLAHQEQLLEWAKNYPPTFADKHALVSAEIARLEGRDLEAMNLYEQAIRLAHDQGFVQSEALAHEVAARFYAARGFDTFAHVYLANARYNYQQWGALGKVRQLEQLHPRLRDGPAMSPATATSVTPAKQFDVVTVVKASQAVSREIVLEDLIKTLMVIVTENAGAERGLLITPREDQWWIEAEANSGIETVEVSLRKKQMTTAELPASVLQYVVRTREPVILHDASKQKLFATDSYITQKKARSIFCLPLIKQGKLVGVLYIENNLAASVFTPDRIEILQLLASQAAISLENARLFADLINENRDRQKAEAALRRSEASLVEAQQISHTGNWRWQLSTAEAWTSAEIRRIFGWDPTETISYARVMDRVHPDDRPHFEQALDRARRERGRFECEFRIVVPDGSIKHLQSVGRPDSESPELEFVGTVIDITERKQAEDALRAAQADLAHIGRLTTMGELIASIVHEISQPINAIANNGNACRRWLDRETPDLREAQAAVTDIVLDAGRAGDVIRSLRSLAKKTGPQVAELDINDAVREVIALMRSHLQREGVALKSALSAEVRSISGDRVQLQQVLLNLIMNGIDAMLTVEDRPRMLVIATEPGEASGILVTVEDTGTGLDMNSAERIFEPLFTTKPDGMGMGLSICRSIIFAHGGRIWAQPRSPCGTTFRFTVPRAPETG